MILTQSDVLRAGAFTGTPTADQYVTAAEIQAAVDTVIERHVGPIVTQTKTWTGAGRAGALVLPWRYQSITSVTTLDTAGNSTVVSAVEYDTTDALRGILRAASGYAPWSYAVRVTVVAVAGSATMPANVTLAAMSLARHWWQLDQAGGRGAWADENAQPLDSGVPMIVRQQLEATPNLPGLG